MPEDSPGTTIICGPQDEARLLPALGPRRARLCSRILGCEGKLTVTELLALYPRDYQDRRQLVRILDLRPGVVGTFFGQISGSAADKRTPTGKTVTHIPVKDGTGVVTLCWFNQPFIKKKLQSGDWYLITGKVERFGTETRITQPDLEKMEGAAALSGGRIVPVYPLTEGLAQAPLRTALRQALDVAGPSLEESLPASIVSRFKLSGVHDATENIHFPTSPQSLDAARRRLKFEELFILQTLLAVRKAREQERPGIKFTIGESVASEIRRMMPFEPTGAQKRVVREIFRDLVRPTPMNRLLQGDVGSGKTVVAAIAVVAAVRNECQVALMAPTEILAEQHAVTFRRLLEPLGIPVRLLTGSTPGRERTAILADLASGELQVVIGTHALIQDPVAFKRLGLVIVDEQHRFGVEQRLKIQQQGTSDENPHVLVMTATPIPRTLSLTAYGHLDVSIIDEMPPGRTPIKTRWVPHARREKVYEYVRAQMNAGRQAYVVCPLVEDSETLEVTSAVGWHSSLQKELFSDVRVGLVHGRMKSWEKEIAMEQFRSGETPILVATTVIEVGVDVPNATVMVVEDANRFGLAQLHQLRGRVGRGEHEGACFLVTDEQYNPAACSPGALLLEPDEAAVGQRRIQILVESCDGFKIAEADFELRGVGIYFGTAQHGRSRLKVADLRHDFQLVQLARQAAFDIIQKDPELVAPEHALLRKRVRGLHLEFQIDEDYTSVA